MKKTFLNIFVISKLCIVLVVVGGGVVRADDSANWGYLQIDIRLEGKQLNSSLYIVKDDRYYSGTSDGLDYMDTEQTLFNQNMSGGFADIENKKITSEYSPNSSRTAKHVKCYYKGIIAPGSEPDMVAELTWQYAEPIEGRFGTMPLILTKEDSDANNIVVGGYRGDLRAEMANSGIPDFVSIPFGKAPAGTYTENGPYFLHLRLDFEKPLADLDNNNEVNLKDLAIVAKYWGYVGACLADITGEFGIPDGNVDMWDLREFCSEWLN